jgi:DNA-binding transcriptional LysR family regulator
MLDAGKLATLRAVIDAGSLSEAARSLALTQPAVSRQVALLEAQLGTPLLRRTRQGVHPTEAGRLLAGHAAEVERRLSLAEEQVAELAGLRRGRVRLGSFFSAFALFTPEIVALTDAHLPGLEIEHELVDRSTAFEHISRGDLDAAIVFEHAPVPVATATSDVPGGSLDPPPVEPPPAAIELIPLFVDPARVLLAAAHPLAAHASLRCADLAGETWIRAHEGGAAALLDHALARAGISPRTLAAGRGEEPVEVQVYVVAGAGIMLAHQLNVIVNHAGIAIRPLEDGPPRHIQLALPRDAPPATRALRSLLEEAHFSAAGQAIR